MADYGCSPLWEPGGEPYPLNPEDLPLSAALRARLWTWAETYAAILNADDPASSDFDNQEARQEFIGEGDTLAQLLRTELGLGFNVEYFNQY